MVLNSFSRSGHSSSGFSRKIGNRVRLTKNKSCAISFFVLICIAPYCSHLYFISANKRLRLSEPDVANQPPILKEAFCERNYSNTGLYYHYPQPQTFSREECACTPVHNFAILSMQRSGSGWFETLLNDHPNITSHGEIFISGKWRAKPSSMRKALDIVYNLEWKNSATKNECTSAVGLKWMINHGLMKYKKEMASYFMERHVSLIFLFRRNSLRRFISVLSNANDRHTRSLNGTHKSHVHSKKEAEALARYKPNLNFATLRRTLRRSKEYSHDALFAFKDVRHIVLYYEDLLKDPKKIFEIQRFLGVPSRDLKSRQVKIHTRPLSEHIRNWDKVYKELNGTELETFLQPEEYK